MCSKYPDCNHQGPLLDKQLGLAQHCKTTLRNDTCPYLQLGCLGCKLRPFMVALLPVGDGQYITSQIAPDTDPVPVKKIPIKVAITQEPTGTIRGQEIKFTFDDRSLIGPPARLYIPTDDRLPDGLEPRWYTQPQEPTDVQYISRPRVSQALRAVLNAIPDSATRDRLESLFWGIIGGEDKNG